MDAYQGPQPHERYGTRHERDPWLYTSEAVVPDPTAPRPPLPDTRVSFIRSDGAKLTTKVKRNAACPCLSGRKFKLCCLRTATPSL